ncbi:MAG: tripartite tricarboxylate transporter substrate-binding protein, partial [Desulfobacterales bacterium]|nr:tripartite tricarboxylate transporter substrate-binding protein [Desulfobacterales bacterium]
PSIAARTVGEFIALARQSPRPLSYGSAGNATTAHLTMEVFRREAGIPMLHIPYKGAAPAMNDLIAGQISSVFDSLTIVMPQHQAGRVRAIAVSGKERSPAYPDIPTVAESGLKDFDVTGWFGIVAPTGTPQPIVDRLTREWTTIVNDPAVRKELVSRGLEPQGKDAQTFGQLISRERAMWQRIITESNIKAD